MKKQLKKLGILALFLVALVGSVFAFPGNFGGNEEAKAGGHCVHRRG